MSVKTLSSISPSYKSGGVVNDLDLNKVQLLKLRQVKWVKGILSSEKLPKNVRSKFLQNLGNCVEELPKKPVGRLSADTLPTVYRQATDR